jgi:hypothetical protein
MSKQKEPVRLVSTRANETPFTQTKPEETKPEETKEYWANVFWGEDQQANSRRETLVSRGKAWPFLL